MTQGPAVWSPFVAASLLLAAVLGFGLGAVLFAAPLLGWPLGRWWQAAAQVHAHAFVFGWAGLMVLGVGFHFLPRLRGRALAHSSWAGAVLGLLLGGILLRALSQPAIDLAAGAGLAPWARGVLATSAGLELAGATLALAMLAATLRGDPPLHERPRLREILPFLATSFGSLWLALALNLASILHAPSDGVLDGADYRLALLIAMYGFLVPICVGVGARLFPLHFAAPMPHTRTLQAGLALLVVGLALREFGELTGVQTVGALGLATIAAAFTLFIVGSRVYAVRRPVAGGRDPWYTDAAQWHGLVAFAFLGLTGVLLLGAALSLLLPNAFPAPPLRLEWHLLGLGFVTVLIFGEAVKLLPGFAARPLRSDRLVWATLGLAVLAVLLRLGPVLAAGLLPASANRMALTASGLLGLLAIVLLAVNLTAAPARREAGRTANQEPLSGSV